MIPLFQGKLNSDKVAQKWKKVLANANFYKYAEQQGFGGVFKNWPNSKYFAPFGRVRNNSNVFGRWLVNTSGMRMQEITRQKGSLRINGQQLSLAIIFIKHF